MRWPLSNLKCLAQGMQVIKDMRVDGLSIYWCPARPLAGSDPADSPIAAWLGSMEQSGVPGQPPDMQDVLPSLSFDLRLSTKHSKHTPLDNTQPLAELPSDLVSLKHCAQKLDHLLEFCAAGQSLAEK